MVWVNNILLSFPEEDEDYFDSVLDALDPKVAVVKGQVHDTDGALMKIEEWEKDLILDMELYPGGRPPPEVRGSWTYDVDTHFYMRDDLQPAMTIVYCNGDYLTYDEEEVKSGHMEYELMQMQYEAIQEQEAQRESDALKGNGMSDDEFDEKMWGLVQDKDNGTDSGADDYERYERWITGAGGAIYGGYEVTYYDLDADLKGLKDSYLEDE